jgi:5-methylcytosine-specific restriction endonuclease McrA
MAKHWNVGETNPKHGKYKFSVTEKELRLLYDQQSIREIAGDYEVSPATVLAHLRRFDIKTRRLGYRRGKYKGKSSWNWQGGKTTKNVLLRTGRRYKLWRDKVFRRDKYVCRECRKRGGSLNAHHDKPFATYKALRFDVSNGITLCEDCHAKKHPNIKTIKKTREV